MDEIVQSNKSPISIITPSFNQGKFIERTIQSVLQQNITSLEYWIIDGGSADETLSILKNYSSQLHWISEEDHGQAHAVNKGLAKSNAEIIGWLNSDDIYYPKILQTVLDFFASHPDIDVLYGDANHIDVNDAIIEKYPVETWDINKFKLRCYLSQPAVFFRRRVISRVGLLNESLHFCMDYEYWLRSALAGAKFYYLPNLFAGSRLYPATKTLSSPIAAQQECLQMLRQQLGSVPREWLITFAATYSKNKYQLRLPMLRFIFLTYAMAVYQSVKLNGCLRGLLDIVRILPTMLNKRRGDRPV